MKPVFCQIRARPGLVCLLVLLVLTAALFASVVLSDDPAWIFGLIGVTDKSAALEFLGIAMGGILIAVQATISHRRAKAMEGAAKAQAEAIGQQAEANRITEAGRRQERLKSSIEHLGHASASVRLGGAYELFHLAVDTPDMRRTALDVLCAHIRRITGEEGYREKYRSKPSEEIQSLLTLLFVREYEVFEGIRVNLRGSWLNGAYIPRARLCGADLAGTYLQDAELAEAQMQGADLLRAQLQKANLHRAHLHGADLTVAQMQGAELTGAHLLGADLGGVRLAGAFLTEARMQGTNLGGAQLQAADLSLAQMQGASLGGIDPRGSSDDIRYSSSTKAIGIGTMLQGARFDETEMQGIATGYPKMDFATRIRESAGRESDLSHVTFAGNLLRDYVDFLAEGLSGLTEEQLRGTLARHIGMSESRDPPHGVVTGIYNDEQAAAWIKDYEEAMAKVPRDRE